MERLWDVLKVIQPQAQATGRGGDQTCIPGRVFSAAGQVRGSLRTST